MYDYVFFVIALISYLIGTTPFYFLAKKAESNIAYFAFIPILNIYLILNICGLSWWVMLLLLIPFLNIVVALYILFEFLALYESGIAVFFIILVSGIASGLFWDGLNFIGVAALWWLALSDKEIS